MKSGRWKLGLVALIMHFVLLDIAMAEEWLSIKRPSFHYREVNVTIDDCPTQLCEKMEDWPSYPNLAFFLSLNPDWLFHRRINSERADLIASYVSSFGYPSTVHCYFHADAEYDPKIDWEGFLRGKPGSVQIGKGYFCVGFVLEKLVEFTDTDLSGDFNPNIDVIVSEYNLLLRGRWAKAETFTRGNVRYLNTTSKDGNFSLQWSSSPVVIKEKGQNFLITPNATRLEVEINNFPYEGVGTKLALKGYVAAQGVPDPLFKEEINGQETRLLIESSTPSKGYFSWANEADAIFQGTHRTPLVKASFKHNPDAFNVDMGLVKAILGTTASIQDVYFSFSDSVQPQHLKWYSATGYGDPPKKTLGADLVLILILFLTLLLPATVIFGIITYRLKSHQQMEESRPILTDKRPQIPPGGLLGPNNPRSSFSSARGF